MCLFFFVWLFVKIYLDRLGKLDILNGNFKIWVYCLNYVFIDLK